MTENQVDMQAYAELTDAVLAKFEASLNPDGKTEFIPTVGQWKSMKQLFVLMRLDMEALRRQIAAIEAWKKQ